MRLKSKSELQAEEAAKKRIRQTVIDNTKLALLYCRQSSKQQVVKNKESALSQTLGARRRAVGEYGFSENLLVLFIENSLDQWGNKLSEEKWRSVSGTLDKIFRSGLREVEAIIESDKAAAVFVDDPSRLFRDETGINPRQFAQICKSHNVVIVTEDRVYDFNATGRNDYQDFVQECDEAAEYLAYLRKTLIRRRLKKGARGGYIGHSIPTGYMLNGEKSGYVPNPYWRDGVKKLSHRFHELGGDFGKLRTEIQGVAIFPDLPDDFDRSRIGRIMLQRVPGGYTVKSHGALRAMLTNAVYIGHKTFNGQIVVRDAHEAIVDEDDFLFALHQLSDTDLDGNEIDRPNRVKRFTHVGKKAEGLLSGVRLDGSPVVTSSTGTVFVFRPDKGLAYHLRDAENGHKGSISLRVVDDALSVQLEKKLNALVLNAEVEKALGGSSEHGAQAVLQHVSSLKNKISIGLAQIDRTILEISQELQRREREYAIAGSVMADEDITAYYEGRARLYSRLNDLKSKRSQEARVHRDIEVVQRRLTTARETWTAMDLEQRQGFIRLITSRVVLDVLSTRFMRLTIEWSPVLAGENNIDTCIFFRRAGAGVNWSGQEDDILRGLFASGNKDEILAHFPGRSWASIKLRGPYLGIKREIRDRKLTVDDLLSSEDRVIADQFGIDLKWIGEGFKVFWGTSGDDIKLVGSLCDVSSRKSKICSK